MSTSPPPKDLTIDEAVLAARSPSELHRNEEALVAAGSAPGEIAGVKAALVAMATEVVEKGHHGCSLPLKRPLRDRIVGSVGNAKKAKYGIYADRLARLFDLTAEKAEALVRKIDDPAAWRPWFTDGTKMIPVKPGPLYPEAMAAVGKLIPGTMFPLHDHVGDECTLVLDGGFRNEDGTEVWRGDECFMPAGSDHRFRVLDGVDCIAAVICYRGVTFR